MGDFQHEKVGGDQDDQQKNAEPAKAESPAIAEVRAMLASGVAHPTGIAKVMLANPAETDAIMALVHQTMGNGFAMELVAALKRDPKKQQGHGPEVGSKNDPMVSSEAKQEAPSEFKPPSAEGKADAMNEANGGTGRGVSPSEKDIAETMADVREVDATPNVYAAGATFGPNGEKPMTKARATALSIDALENDLEENKAPEGPVEASKVLKEETVIASSAEVKQPEIARATEVLKDPDQKPDEPQRASDVVKDDDAENEGSGGATKPDVGPVKITASVLRVRSSPKLGKDNIVGKLTKGTVVEAIGHSGEWVEIKHKGETAFVHSSFVIAAQEAAIPKASDQGAAATVS